MPHLPTSTPSNPNLPRRRARGRLAFIFAQFLRPWIWLLHIKPTKQPAPLTVFQSFLVGDFFMALPALKTLSAHVEIQVLCRPDCLPILQAEGLQGLSLDNRFFLKPTVASFFSTLRAAWSLRGQLGSLGLDFDADPRSALWMKVAGVRRISSYNRPYSVLFDRLFPLPMDAVHQADKNLAVIHCFLAGSSYLHKHPLAPAQPKQPEKRPAAILDSTTAPWMISCWTRKDTKNWPLEKWDGLLKKMTTARLPLLLLDAPDGNAEFKNFVTRWSNQVGIVRGTLSHIAAQIQVSAGVVATDNFLGHMAGYYNKPVLWINGSSDPSHVLPKGPRSILVQTDPMPCRPCGHRCDNPKHKDCLESLRVETVWKAFEELRGLQPS